MPSLSTALFCCLSLAEIFAKWLVIKIISFWNFLFSNENVFPLLLLVFVFFVFVAIKARKLYVAMKFMILMNCIRLNAFPNNNYFFFLLYSYSFTILVLLAHSNSLSPHHNLPVCEQPTQAIMQLVISKPVWLTKFQIINFSNTLP